MYLLDMQITLIKLLGFAHVLQLLIMIFKVKGFLLRLRKISSSSIKMSGIKNISRFAYDSLCIHHGSHFSERLFNQLFNLINLIINLSIMLLFYLLIFVIYHIAKSLDINIWIKFRVMSQLI